MSISTMQQLEAFAFWRRQLLAAPMGQQLWGLDKAVEAKLMNQAPLYALAGQKVDFYVEAPLCGQPQVDLSAQYFAEAFAEDNPLQGLKVEQEGDFFHFYAKALATSKRELLRHSNLYLEADITDESEPKVASFINLSGDFVEVLLHSVLAYRGRLKQLPPVRTLLEKVQEWCEPWHFGFMESREIRPLRLVLILKQGLKDLERVLERIAAPTIPKERRELLNLCWMWICWRMVAWATQWAWSLFLRMLFIRQPNSSWCRARTLQGCASSCRERMLRTSA